MARDIKYSDEIDDVCRNDRLMSDGCPDSVGDGTSLGAVSPDACNMSDVGRDVLTYTS